MITMITGLIGGLLYPLFSVIFWVIDLLQGVFAGLAGIGDIQFRNNSFGSKRVDNITAPNGGDGGEQSTGLIYYLLTTDLIKNLFMSILILALILIIIFTAMAFIKNAYASKQKTWQEIVGNAFKGLANFIFIPVCCLLGVWLSNILLVAINGATSTGGATQMSRKLFICCAYDANEYRIGTNSVKTEQDAKDLEEWAKSNGVDVAVEFGKDGEYYAAIVDQVFAESNIDIHWYYNVEVYYSLFNFNYLILIVGGVFMLYVLVSLAYAMIKRMFILVMLFVVSPALCAMYPLDEGAAVGNWKKEFIKYTISAYGAIAGLNLFFSILPIVENINIIATGTNFGGAFLNDMFQLLIMVSGLFVVKEFMGTLSGWIGGDNALATGENMRKQTKDAMNKYAKPVVKGTVGAFGNQIGYAKARRDSGQGWFRSTLGSWKDSLGDDFLGKKNDKGKREGGLFRYMGGESYKNVEETFKAAGDEFKRGKSARDAAEKISADTAVEKGQKKALAGFKFGEEFKNATGDNQNEKVRQVVEKYKKLGGEENIAFAKLASLEDEDKSKVFGKEATAYTIKEKYGAGVEAHDEAEKEKAKNENRTESCAANAELANAIGKEVKKVMESVFNGNGSVQANVTGGTVSGVDSAVEATARERMENKLTQRSNELLEQLIAIQKEQNSSNPTQVTGDVKILDQFGNAINTSEDRAQKAMDEFVEDMKKSAEVQKALSGLDKEIGRTEDDLKSLAKTINEIAKNSKNKI